MASQPVYLEIVDFFAAGTTPQTIIDFQPSPEARHRAQTAHQAHQPAPEVLNLMTSWRRQAWTCVTLPTS